MEMKMKMKMKMAVHTSQSSRSAGSGLFESPLESFLHALYSSQALRNFLVWLRQLFYLIAATTPESRPTSDSGPPFFSGTPAAAAVDDDVFHSIDDVLAQKGIAILTPSDDVDRGDYHHGDHGGDQRWSTQRFSVYFQDDGLIREEDVEMEQQEEVEEEVVLSVAPEGDDVLEVASPLHIRLPMQRRSCTGDLSNWYRCQDLSVLNGSVVRFWDGAVGSRTSSRRCRRSPTRRT